MFWSWCDGAQANHVQGIAEGPAFWQVILDVDIRISNILACQANAVDNILDCRFVNKIFQAQLVRVLEFELVVVGQQTNKSERCEYLLRRFGLLDKLSHV